MFRVDDKFRIGTPTVFQSTGSVVQGFRAVEQCFDLPLWHIHVLPFASDSDESSRWIRMLTSSAVDALDILLGKWQAVKVNILIPEYLSCGGEMQFARCSALWECRGPDGDDMPVWLFETDQGTFIDPEFDLLQPNKVDRLALRWTAI